MTDWDILKKLEPCDTQLPYIFISYSSEDREIVWQDVYEFQRRGYNIWLDEKNLDKKKESWRQDALSAIEDMDCRLVVFYVSENSLCSDCCYQELRKMEEEATCMMHGKKPVRFIAVDAEPIGDITQVRESMSDKLLGDLSRPKKERTKRMLALQRIMEEFFHDSNEKVRISPKNEANRKRDYYEEIIAEFPEITMLPSQRARDAARENSVGKEMTTGKEASAGKEIAACKEPASVIGEAVCPGDTEETLFEKLRLLRLEIAREEGVDAYRVFHDSTLKSMCASRPKTKKELLKISGVGEKKCEKYGERFLRLLRGVAD